MKVGDTAPDFTLRDQNGKFVSLSHFKGKKIALYFYPKDDTPGCTAEACSFRDYFGNLTQRGIVVIGISPDDEMSHQLFIKKHKLPFILLTDATHTVLQRYDAWGKKMMYGKEYTGVLRKTYLLNEEGKIVHIFDKPTVDVHAREVLEIFDRMRL